MGYNNGYKGGYSRRLLVFITVCVLLIVLLSTYFTTRIDGSDATLLAIEEIKAATFPPSDAFIPSSSSTPNDDDNTDTNNNLNNNTNTNNNNYDDNNSDNNNNNNIVRNNKRVVLVENNGWHEEVIAPILYSVAKITSNLTLNYFYMRFGIEPIYRFLVPDNQAQLFVQGKYEFDASIDVLILVTCERDLIRHKAALYDHIEKSSTHIVCIVHHTDKWVEPPLSDIIQPFLWAKRVTFVTLSAHTHRYLVPVFPHTRIEWFVPVFPTNIPPFHKKTNTLALQGLFEPTRRSYDKFFSTLEVMHRVHNITVDLLGSGKTLPEIPPALVDIVHIREKLEYPDFYKVLGKSLAILTAFASPNYFVNQASSSIPAALISGTPVVANSTVLNTYSYLTDDVVWRANDHEDELACIDRLFESGEIATLNDKRRNIEALREKLYRKNDVVWRRIINRTP